MKESKVQRFRILIITFSLAALFACGFAIRIAVLRAQAPRGESLPPFTLESALQFRLVRTLLDNGRLPVRDMAIQVPDGVLTAETYTVGAEYVYALLARLLPRSYPLEWRLRLVSAAWFCLGIPLLSLWLLWWLGSRRGALVGGAFYAVALSSVIRSTGEELSHENFALPLLIGHFAMNALAESRARGRLFWTATVLSALLLGCAAATWDMIQFYLLLWAALGFARCVKGDYFREGRRAAAWLIHLAALILVGTINPYLRAHAFPVSYAMLLAYGTALALAFDHWIARKKGEASGMPAPGRRLGTAALALVPLAIGIVVFRSYGDTYGHFLELLWAKLKFLNQKPPDPELLTFVQRILWTPALNSANLRLTGMLFPAMFPLIILAVPVILLDAPWRSDPEFTRVLFCSIVSLPAFVLFIRFHVFLAIFCAAILGWLGARAFPRKGESRRADVVARWRIAGWIVCLLLSFGIAAEAAHTLDRPERWGRNIPYVAEQVELAGWLRDNAPEAPVLANFGLSAFLLAYAGNPIVLHPKFESVEIRNRVQAYGEKLFLSDEKEFREWADRHGAKVLVFSMGEFSPYREDLQMRYFVNALNPPTNSAARLFDGRPDDSRYFVHLWSNVKYRVFRIIGRSDELEAERYAADSAADFSRGLLDDAEHKADLALAYDPNNGSAMQLLLSIRSLRGQGVGVNGP